MIIKLLFKTPDVLDQVDKQVKEEFPELEGEELRNKIAEIKKICRLFVEYDEYGFITIDTDKEDLYII